MEEGWATVKKKKKATCNEKIKLDPFLTYEVNPRWIKHQNVRRKTVKYSEGITEKYFYNIGIAKAFLTFKKHNSIKS